MDAPDVARDGLSDLLRVRLRVIGSAILASLLASAARHVIVDSFLRHLRAAGLERIHETHDCLAVFWRYRLVSGAMRRLI